MADTARTLSVLLNSLFADGQSVGAITPQDMRDLIVSLTPPYGGCYITSSAPTAISTPGTYVKAAGTTAVTNVRDVTMPTDNRLTYTGSVDSHFHMVLSVSATTAGSNDNLGFAIAKNGVVLDHTKLTRFVSTGSDRGALAAHGDVMMSTNDYLEAFVTNLDASASVTLNQCYLFCMGMIAS